MKTKSYYTFMISGPRQRRLKSLSLERKTLISLLGALWGALFLLMFFIADWAGLHIDQGQLALLKKENRDLRQELLIAGQRLGELEQNVQQVDDFSKKLKKITNIPLTQIGGRQAHFIHGEAFLSPSPSSQAQQSLAAPPGAPSPSGEKGREAFPLCAGALVARMDRLEGATRRLKQNIWALHTDLAERQEILFSTPSIMPVRGWISSSFGYRNETIYSDHEPHFHRGVDIAASEGRPVRASADGQVIYSGYDESGYGYLIIISHGHGLKTLYAHLAEIKTQEGAKVARGEEIGLVGNTGRSTGPHLHYEVRIFNQPVNPENYILDKNDLPLEQAVRYQTRFH